LRVDWSLCGYCILSFPFVSFVPIGRTRRRAVPVLVLYCPPVCFTGGQICGALLVETPGTFWARLVAQPILKTQGMRFLFIYTISCNFLQNVFFFIKKSFLWVCWKRSLYVPCTRRGKIVYIGISHTPRRREIFGSCCCCSQLACLD